MQKNALQNGENGNRGTLQPLKSIQELEKAVWESFDTILSLVCSAQDPRIFECALFMDDFYKPGHTDVRHGDDEFEEIVY